MSSLTQAADDARRLLRGFKAFEEVAAALDQVATLEQRKNELEVAIETLKAEAQDAERQRDEQAAKLKTLKGKVAEAEGFIDAASSAAQARGAEIVAEANVKAGEIIAAAKAAAAEAQANAQSAVEAGQQVLAEAEARFNVVKADTEALEARAAEARAYLAKLAG